MSYFQPFTVSSYVGEPGMKLKKTTGEYVASNVSFNPETLEATSFKWWYFVKRIGGKVVFNDYRYSSFTSRHQNKVRLLMKRLGIKIDLEIEAPKGLQDLQAAHDWYEGHIIRLVSLMSMPRTHAAKNAERAHLVRLYQEKVKTIRKLIAKQERE